MLKNINQKAAAVFSGIVKDMQSVSDYKKLDSSAGVYMPLSVECIDIISAGHLQGRVYLLAHYYSQNGDLMSDPEMTFLQLKKHNGAFNYMPLTFTQSSISSYQECAIFERGEFTKYSKALMKDLAVFAGQWLVNIKHQQVL